MKTVEYALAENIVIGLRGIDSRNPATSRNKAGVLSRIANRDHAVQQSHHTQPPSIHPGHDSGS